ncbi:MAG: hypothetical protein ACLQVN_09600 [Bryobacteraceae bacterium]
MRRICRYLPLSLLLSLFPVANAQSQFDINMGFGAAQAKAASTGIEGSSLSTNFLGSCTTSSDPTCVPTSSLSGFMLGFGGTVLLKHNLGFGIDFTTQPAKDNYATLSAAIDGLGAPLTIQSRTTFYDFDAVYQPVAAKRAALRLFGGVGGDNLKFYTNETSTTALTGSQSYSSYFGSSNHFAANFGAGVMIYVTDHMFIEPQFKAHWVNNLTQYGSSFVTEETVWVGYSWGNK